MRIAIMDATVLSTNPIGSCHLRIVERLCSEHKFVVFAADFENPCPEKVVWVRVPVVRRPLALLYITFHLGAALRYASYRMRRVNSPFDLIQIVETNVAFGDLSYTQFCHRAYLHDNANGGTREGLRGWLRRFDHQLHALTEPWVFRRVKTIVVPSAGLADELADEYPVTRSKVKTIPNPVDVRAYERPSDFDLDAQRAQLGFSRDDVVVAFIALGHFERKGLPLLFEVLTCLRDSPIRLLVVGGRDDLIRRYQKESLRRGLANAVTFTGMQGDIRPFLWSADALALPSSYETFSLVCFQAAAAGLPLVVTRLHGVEDLVRDGQNGLVVDRTVDDITNALSKLASMTKEERASWGERAQAVASDYGVEQFVERWKILYRDLENQ